MRDDVKKTNKTKTLVNKYDKKPTRGINLTKQAEHDALRIYKISYEAVLVKIQRGFQRGNWWTVTRQYHILKGIYAEIDRLERRLGKFYKRALNDANNLATTEGMKDIAAIYDENKLKYKDHLHRNAGFTKIMFDDTMGHVAGRTQNMKNRTKTLLRRAAQEVFRRASVEGTSRVKAARMIEQNMMGKMPDFEFVDRAGRKWNNTVYFRMLTRTVMSNTLNQDYTNTLTSEGHDLVKVSYNAASDACTNWEGKILSLTGATPGKRTVAAARGTGEVFHPNCRHRLIAYHPELEQFIEENK